MENASKALLIAGAILIAIILISLGIGVLNQGKATVDNANMSEFENTQFNEKFTQYEGTAVKGTKVKQMVKQTLQHNLQQDDTSTQVKITKGGSEFLKIEDTGLPADMSTEILNQETYTVKCTYNKGRVTTIDFK